MSLSKNQIKVFVLTVTAVFGLATSGCRESDIENRRTLERLYEQYQNGEIFECTCKGQTVYSAMINAYDAGGGIYDKDGNTIGSCNYAWGMVDPICSQLTDCQIVYRVRNSISGLPPVDKYGLAAWSDRLTKQNGF